MQPNKTSIRAVSDEYPLAIPRRQRYPILNDDDQGKDCLGA